MARKTRNVMVWRGPAHTVHELDCSFLTRRVNNGLDLNDQYDEVPISKVPVGAKWCFFCAGGFTR